MDFVTDRTVTGGEISSAAKAAEYRGRSSPLGAIVLPGGVNFSVYSRNATGVELLLFNREDETRAERIISLDPATNRTFHYWHIFVPDVRHEYVPIMEGSIGRRIE